MARIITAEMLEKCEFCPTGLERFKRDHPNGLGVTTEVVAKWLGRGQLEMAERMLYERTANALHNALVQAALKMPPSADTQERRAVHLAESARGYFGCTKPGCCYRHEG